VTLWLLRHVLRMARRLLVIGAFRGEEVGALHPVAAVVQDVRRAGGEVIALEGLPGDDELHRLTGGNPLFMREGGLSPLVRELVLARVERLPDSQVLRAAAVAGDEFVLEEVAAALDAPAHAIAEALEPAVAGRLVSEDAVGRYAFTPPLVRAVLLGELTATRRAQLEQRYRRTSSQPPTMTS
jgi:hypothetical protein